MRARLERHAYYAYVCLPIDYTPYSQHRNKERILQFYLQELILMLPSRL